MRMMFSCVFLLLLGCATGSQNQFNVQGDISQEPGWVYVFQTFTSKDQTSINILRPRLAKLAYYVVPAMGDVKDFNFSNHQPQKVIKTVKGPHIHWQVDRIHVKNLNPIKPFWLIIVFSFH